MVMAQDMMNIFRDAQSLQASSVELGPGPPLLGGEAVLCC